MTRSRNIIEKRRRWSTHDIAVLRQRYPHEPTRVVALALGRRVHTVYAMANQLGLHKTAEYLSSPSSGRLLPDDNRGGPTRFLPGHVPANKGLRRPGWAPGRMRETQYKKGHFPINRDPDYYVIGALRVNSDGYIDMRVSFELGARGWRALHRILWEDVHGPVPRTHALTFKNGDKLDVELGNLELISRADLMRRNTVHNLPAPLKSTIQVLGQLKRRIREKQDRGSSQPPVRDARRSAGRREADGHRAREGGGTSGAGDR